MLFFLSFFLLEKSIDVLSPFRLFSLDIILRAGFGLDAQIQTDPDQEMVEKALTVLETPVYVRAMSMFPFYKQVKEFFDLNLSPHSPYFIALSKSILEKRKISSSGRRDLFQLMLEARDENAEGTQKLTDEEIVAQSVLFLIAGSETNGTTIAFFAFYLAHHPDVQEKLLGEIDHASKSRGDAPIGEFVQSLQYRDRVVSEGLRHSSVGFGDVRQCMETCVINGVEFPQGVSVNIPAYAIHRDPDFCSEVMSEIVALTLVLVLAIALINSYCNLLLFSLSLSIALIKSYSTLVLFSLLLLL